MIIVAALARCSRRRGTAGRMTIVLVLVGVRDEPEWTFVTIGRREGESVGRGVALALAMESALRR